MVSKWDLTCIISFSDRFAENLILFSLKLLLLIR